jgi:hypothetical protein
VRPALDAAHAVSGVATAAQGLTLNATAADGSQLLLVVPPGALLSPVKITMTPISQIGGLPGRARLLAGAQFAPDGLQFLKPVALTVLPAQRVAAKQLQPFGYAGAGRDFYFQPFPKDSGGRRCSCFTSPPPASPMQVRRTAPPRTRPRPPTRRRKRSMGSAPPSRSRACRSCSVATAKATSTPATTCKRSTTAR